MKRDPARIDIVIEVLREVWKQSPDQRLGQLLVNIDTASIVPDLFMLEDAKLLKILEDVYVKNEVNRRKVKP